MAEETVLGNIDLRRHIWSFLRYKAHLICVGCNKVLEWNPNIKVNDYCNFFNKMLCFECTHKSLDKFMGCYVS